MIREGAMDFFCFGFFTVGGGDTISCRKRGSRLFLCFVGPKALEKSLVIKVNRIGKK